MGVTGGTVSYLAFFLQKDNVCFQTGKRKAPDCFRVTSLIQSADTMATKRIEKMRLKIKSQL